jgi:uncharacterized protein YihD (DUF1040 family)
MKNITKACWSIKLLMAMLIVRPTFAQTINENNNEVTCLNETEFKNNMRKLLEDHIIWTRNTLLCIVDDMPGREESINRLIRNQVETALIFKQFYGDKVGNDLADLLKAHISIYKELVVAYDRGSREEINDATKRWYDNADEISELLLSINPYWKQIEIRNMITTHLKLKNDAALQRILRNWGEDVVTYDKLHIDVLKIADILSDGIINQFSQKFDTGILYSDKK